MLDLTFRDRLRNPDAFENGDNQYVYADANSQAGTGVIYSPTGLQPVFMAAPDYPNTTEVVYSPVAQFNGRAVITSRVRQVLNGAQVPVILRILGNNYLVAKGFIAHHGATITPLLLTLIQGGTEVRAVKDLLMVANKEVLTHSRFSAVKSLIQEEILSHPGETIVTQNIAKYWDAQIELPQARTVKEKLSLEKEIIHKAIDKMKVFE